MIFLVLPGKMIFLFSENMILFFKRKRKGDLSQKNPQKYDVFFKFYEKMMFPRKLHWNTVCFVIFGKMDFFFSQKYDIFSFHGK